MEVLQRWAEGRLGYSVGVELAGQAEFSSGFSSREILRLDVRAWSSDERCDTLQVVFKRTVRSEVLAIRALRDIPHRPAALPELIDDGTDERGPWLLMPYYPRPYDQGVPVPVFEALARVHSWYLDRDGELQGLEPTDHRYWKRHCLEIVLPHVERALGAGRHPILDRAHRFLHERADDEPFLHALALLPRTLVHGDMHPANVLVTPLSEEERRVVSYQQYGEARSAPHRMRTLEVTIIDWGNARIGPAMLDLGNITKPGTIAFASYLRTWERCTGVTADPWLTRVGFLWATAYVNTLYMAFAVAQGTHTGRGPREGWAGLGSMIDRAETALGELERALDRQP